MPSNRAKKPSLPTGRDPVSQLYRAVARYVASKGGSVLVTGGIQILRWPGDGVGNFAVGVKCTGKLDTTAFREGRKDA
jgi:hypothetical protein